MQLAACDCSDAIRIEPADGLFGPVAEARDPATRRVPGESADEVLADDRRAVEPDEQLGVEPFLERRHRMVDEPAAAPDVEPHVIALGRHPVDILGRDPHQSRQVGSPEFLEPLRIPLFLVARLATLEVGSRAFDRSGA